MPNKGYFIQQMTRHGAGTLFGISEAKDKWLVPSVKKNFIERPFVTRGYPSDLTESEWNLSAGGGAWRSAGGYVQ